MSDLKKLQERTDTVRAMLEKSEAALTADPNNFAHQLSRNSLREHLAEVEFQRGVVLLNVEGNAPSAEQAFREAIALRPASKGLLLNSMLHSTGEDWSFAINGLRMVLRIAPDYGYARDNLAVAFLNYGVEKAQEGSLGDALELFYNAIGITNDEEITSKIRENFAATHVQIGIKFHEAYQKDHNIELLTSVVMAMRRAVEVFPDRRAQRNLGKAYAHLALAYLKNDDLQEAIVAFERAEDTGLLHHELLNDYGVALAASVRLDEAIRAFERAIELAPEDEGIKKNLALAVSRFSSGSRGVEHFQVAEEFAVEGFRYPFEALNPIAFTYQQSAAA